MSPWDFIGWCIAFWFAFWISVVIVLPVLVALSAFISNRWKWFRTRKVAPMQGQLWRQGGSNLYIKRIVPENGRIVMESGCATWSDSPDEWKKRVRTRKLWLVR